MLLAKRPLVIHVTFLLHNLCRRTDAATLSLLDGTPASHQAMHVEQGQGSVDRTTCANGALGRSCGGV